jgi:hypothetical protein
VSQNIALIGEFEHNNQTLVGDRHFIAAINTQIVTSAVSQVYAPSLSFNVIDNAGELMSGTDLLNPNRQTP